MIKYLTLLCLALATIACVRKAPQLPANKVEQTEPGQDLLQFNKACLQAEQAEIEQFIDSHPQFVLTEAGWWLNVITPGKGAAIQPNQTVNISYSIERLDGTVCYSSATDGDKTIEVGKRQWLQGIDLLLPTLAMGSKVEVIFPSRMAYGLRGSAPCIGSYCPLLCRLLIKDNEYAKN